MSRTILSPSRRKNFINTNIGHMILFCEGMTEKHYFEYFAEIINKNKFSDVKIEIESVKGNAGRVLKFADEYLLNEENCRKYNYYKKYLIFDCDAPPNIQKTIINMLDSENKYELLVSNFLFEIWLLMHFENVTEKISKKETYKRLSRHLATEYDKASVGIIREIIQNGDIEEAINNAENLAKKYTKEGKEFSVNIKEMNPYTNVNILVEQLIAAIS